MNKSGKIILGVICCVLSTACVSTTTGTMAPEGDDIDAAEQNYQLGARYYQNGQYELARDRLILSIELDPRRAISYSTLGLTYEALDNVRLATESYEKAVRAEPRNIDVLNTYAVFLCKQKDFDGAQKHFRRAADHPENDNAEITLTNAGICMTQKPDLAAAEGYFRKALDSKTNYADALLQLCLLKFHEQDYLSSRAFLQRYISSNKTTAGVLFLGAQIEGKLGDERARTDFVNRLLREFPTSSEARKVLENG